MINVAVAELMAEGVKPRTAYRRIHPGKKQMNPVVKALIENGVNRRTAFRRANFNDSAQRKTKKKKYSYNKGEYV